MPTMKRDSRIVVATLAAGLLACSGTREKWSVAGGAEGAPKKEGLAVPADMESLAASSGGPPEGVQHGESDWSPCEFVSQSPRTVKLRATYNAAWRTGLLVTYSDDTGVPRTLWVERDGVGDTHEFRNDDLQRVVGKIQVSA